MANDYYVYLLVEELRSGDEEVFYVGKGKGTRGGAHLLEYVRSTIAGTDTSAALRLAGARPLAGVSAGRSDHDVGLVTRNATEREEHAKVQRIREAHRAGNTVRVDLLRTDLAENDAYVIESAVIDAIGLDRLTNLVHGHGHGRVPVLAAMRVLDAASVTIDETGYQVVVAGVWGGGNTLSGLMTAEPDDIWENARQSWAISPATRRAIQIAGASPKPFVLVAVAKGPTATYGGIVLGVWEIARLERASDRIDSRGQATEGWSYVAAPDSPRVSELRARYLHRRSLHPRQVRPTKLP